jgi:hypothetical protein
LEPRKQLAEWLEREIERWPATADCAQAEPAGGCPDAPDVGSTPTSIPAQAVEALRGPSRRQVAEQLLDTVGRTRPVVARDVAERYGHGVDHPQRENARLVLNRLVTLGKAVRLADGSFVPADLAANYTGKAAEAVVAEQRRWPPPSCCSATAEKRARLP